jgi:hypothetical protein
MAVSTPPRPKDLAAFNALVNWRGHNAVKTVRALVKRCRITGALQKEQTLRPRAAAGCDTRPMSGDTPRRGNRGGAPASSPCSGEIESASGVGQ